MGDAIEGSCRSEIDSCEPSCLHHLAVSVRTSDALCSCCRKQVRLVPFADSACVQVGRSFLLLEEEEFVERGDLIQVSMTRDDDGDINLGDDGVRVLRKRDRRKSQTR